MEMIAKTGVQPAESGRQLYLAFALGGHLYAVDISGVREIVTYGQLTALPAMPEYLRGIIRRQEGLTPVIDLACRFDQVGTRLTRRSCIVVVTACLEGEAIDIGMVVDGVSEVLEISQEQIKAAPALQPGIPTDFLAGIGQGKTGEIMILDLGRLLFPGDRDVLRLATELSLEAQATH